jgi:hypothetical protein
MALSNIKAMLWLASRKLADGDVATAQSLIADAHEAANIAKRSIQEELHAVA